MINTTTYRPYSPVNNNHKKFSFQGKLNENMKFAEKALKFFNKEFGFVRSSTRLQARIDKLKQNSRFNNSNYQLKTLERRVDHISEDMHSFHHAMKTSMVYPKSERVKECIKLTKTANCPHQSEVVARYLKDNGADVKRMGLTIKENGKEPIHHMFPVIGLNPNAKIEEMHTWGNDAVIADPWSNFSAKASNGIRFLLDDVFKFNPSKQKVSFWEVKEPF